MRHDADYTNAARLTLGNNGGTFTFTGAQVLHRRGYYVGGLVPTAIVAAFDVPYIADCLERFVQQHVVRTEDREDIYLGTWVNGGNVYIDLSNWIPDRDQAIGLGRERGELAVWDCERGEEVTL
jgi:hypothetical protein